MTTKPESVVPHLHRWSYDSVLLYRRHTIRQPIPRGDLSQPRSPDFESFYRRPNLYFSTHQKWTSLQPPPPLSSLFVNLFPIVWLVRGIPSRLLSLSPRTPPMVLFGSVSTVSDSDVSPVPPHQSGSFLIPEYPSSSY